MAECSFCGEIIPKGTGKMFVKVDGTILYYCTRKCEKNAQILKRNPRFQKWTKNYEKGVKR
jgi:large subunit ribosomal protein L24e